MLFKFFVWYHKSNPGACTCWPNTLALRSTSSPCQPYYRAQASLELVMGTRLASYPCSPCLNLQSMDYKHVKLWPVGIHLIKSMCAFLLLICLCCGSSCQDLVMRRTDTAPCTSIQFTRRKFISLNLVELSTQTIYIPPYLDFQTCTCLSI